MTLRFTVQGSGVFLYGYADAFHFVYQPMNTSGTIIARVTSAGTGGAYVAAMIRETLDANAANMSVGGYVSTSATAGSYYRSFIGGYELTAGSTGLILPYWLRVTRSANQFTAYARPGWRYMDTRGEHTDHHHGANGLCGIRHSQRQVCDPEQRHV